MHPKDIPVNSHISKFLTPKKLITWDKNGVPKPFTDWILPKSKIDDVLLAAMTLPYTGTLRPDGEEYLEPEYDGLTNIEVAAIKQAKKAASGDLESYRFAVERLLGKPKQQVEQTTLTISLKDYLTALDLGPVGTIDVEYETVTDSNKDEWDV